MNVTSHAPLQHIQHLVRHRGAVTTTVSVVIAVIGQEFPFDLVTTLLSQPDVAEVILAPTPGNRDAVNTAMEHRLATGANRRHRLRMAKPVAGSAAATPLPTTPPPPQESDDVLHGVASAAARAPIYPASTFPSVGEQCNAGAAAASTSSSHLLFMLDQFSVEQSFVRQLLKASETDADSIVGCTVVTPAPKSRDKSSVPVVVERGSEMLLGYRANQPAPFVAKRLSGHPSNDARARTAVDSAPLLSPYCMAVPRALFERLHGFPRLWAPSLLAAIAAGQFDSTDAVRAAVALVPLARFVEQALEAISLEEVRKADVGLRRAVRRAYAAVVEAAEAYEKATQRKWADTSRSAELSRGQLRRYTALELAPRLDALATHVGLLIKAALKGSEAGPTGSVEEEARYALDDEAGWDLSIRARAAGFSSLVSNATATLLPQLHSPRLAAFAARRVGANPLTRSTLPVASAFLKRWASELRREHPALAVGVAAPLSVVWDAYCCNCCGFTNEIVHFVYPLQRLYRVSLVPAESCFCSGFPSAVEDSLRRMHLTAEAFQEVNNLRDEIVVWISHTDPMSYDNNQLFVKRRPHYVVGRSMYEFTRIDDNWVVNANTKADEIWVPSTFVRNSFIRSGVDPEKIQIVAEAVDVHFFDPAALGKVALPPPVVKRPSAAASSSWVHWCNKRPPNAENHYKFLSSFKWEPRKGWDTLFEAWHRAFAHQGANVSLYVLSHIWFSGGPETYGDRHNTTFLREEVTRVVLPRLGIRSLEEMPHFCFITSDLSEVEVAELYNSVDAFVLPTRGEGWGLPLIQAMSMGLPTIGSAWGGQTDFMTPQTAFLIAIDAVEELPQDSVYRWQQGKKWSTPSVNSTTELLRSVFLDQDRSRRVGAAARRHIVEHFSEEALVHTVDLRLREIREIVLGQRLSRPAQ